MNTIPIHPPLRNQRVASDAQETVDAFHPHKLTYHRLFEEAQEGVLILDLSTGRIEEVTPFLTNLLGFSREEMIGKTIGEISPFNDLVTHQGMLDLLQQFGYVGYKDLPLEAKDGSHVDVELVSNVFEDGGAKKIQCNIRKSPVSEKRDEPKTQPTMHIPHPKHLGIELDDTKKIARLERENAELKKLLADALLENRALKCSKANKAKNRAEFAV